MASPTLLQLRTRTRERANMENSTFVTDSELNRYINYSINQLRDLMIKHTGEEYFASSTTFALVDGTEEYSLPADFYKVISCQMLGDNQLYFPMKRFEYSEQNEFARPLYYRNADVRYKIRGSKLVVNPFSQIGGRTVRMLYVPIPTELSADGDTLDGLNGWDEYVVVRSAIKCLVKEEQDVSELASELRDLELRMEEMADFRDQSQPERVQDTSRMSRGSRYYQL